ncbi:hypothetical protein SASPL_134101 [Salvia splendens]|uniref:indole-3-glycerol-phosphate synthase n=1 Tax=Salvia splendens TaxID=180675 RepID=A0A8X8ZJ44_SALSN|nr:hypothetical protein SASPL_134101 [Salvia splendens]
MEGRYVVEINAGLASMSNPTISNEDLLKVKEWEIGMLQGELAASQGISIRRRPPTGPPPHYAGPFEYHLQNEGKTPCNILEEIIWYKDVEVSEMKKRKPLSMLKMLLDNAPPARDFVGALKAANSRTGVPGLIAEVKKASPSRGVMREDFDPLADIHIVTRIGHVLIAKAYEKGGAPCLSVLTDEKFFQGSFENLEAIRNSGVQCPLLCKEFIIDAWQIYYARVKGADAILLIAAVLPDLDIKYMVKICKLLGLAALVEVHNEREMDRVLALEGIELVGINNRDLGTFKVDISNTKTLLEGERGERIRERGIIVVGESGLFTPADIAYVQGAGVKAVSVIACLVLVGESIVKQKDPTAGIVGLFGTTWLKSLLYSILNRSSKHKLAFKHPHELVPFLEGPVLMQSNELPFSTALSNTCRLFSTHISYQLLAKTLDSCECRIVYVTRNPKDTLVSLWHFMNKRRGHQPWTINEAVDAFCYGVTPYGPYYDHVIGYRALYLKRPKNVMFVTYEEMKEDPHGHVKKLGDFLGCPFDGEEEVDEIVKNCSFEVLSSHEVNKSEQSLIKNLFPYNSFFRKGITGDHENYLSNEVIQRIDTLTKHRFHSLGFMYGI